MHAQRTPANKAEAAKFAAYQATIFLFPGAKEPLLGYLTTTTSNFSSNMLNCTDNSLAACLGNSAALNVIEARKKDGSSQERGYVCAIPPCCAL